MRSGRENVSTVIKHSPVNYKGEIFSPLLNSVDRICAVGPIPGALHTWEIVVGSKRITNRRSEESPEGEDRHFGRRHGDDDPGAAARRSGVSRLAISEAPARPAGKLRRAEYYAAAYHAGHSTAISRSGRRYHQVQHVQLEWNLRARLRPRK